MHEAGVGELDAGLGGHVVHDVVEPPVGSADPQPAALPRPEVPGLRLDLIEPLPGIEELPLRLEPAADPVVEPLRLHGLEPVAVEGAELEAPVGIGHALAVVIPVAPDAEEAAPPGSMPAGHRWPPEGALLDASVPLDGAEEDPGVRRRGELGPVLPVGHGAGPVEAPRQDRGEGAVAGHLRRGRESPRPDQGADLQDDGQGQGGVAAGPSRLAGDSAASTDSNSSSHRVFSPAVTPIRNSPPTPRPGRSAGSA